MALVGTSMRRCGRKVNELDPRVVVALRRFGLDPPQPLAVVDVI